MTHAGIRPLKAVGHILVTLIAMLTLSCADEDADNLISNNVDLPFERELKVLCIGNSFTQDAFSYVPVMFHITAPDVKLTIGMAYIGGSPLAQHWVNLTGRSTTLDGTTFSPAKYIYHKAESLTARWYTCHNVTLDSILADEKWDIITFQQNGKTAGCDYDIYFAPYLDDIKEYARRKTAGDPKFGWVLVHGAYHINDDGMRENWRMGMLNSRRVMEEGGFDLLFPYGTAVQNLRDYHGVLNQSNGLGWTYDNGHLQEGLGCLVSAYTNILVLFDEGDITPVRDLSQFILTRQLLEYMKIPNPQIGKDGLVGITEDNCRIALEAARAAVAEPYAVTALSPVTSADDLSVW